MNELLLMLAILGPVLWLVMTSILIQEARETGGIAAWIGAIIVSAAIGALYWQILMTCKMPSKEESDRFWRDFLDKPQPKEPEQRWMRDKTTGEGLSIR